MLNKTLHWIAALVLIGIPFIMNTHAPFLDFTLGGILNGIYLILSQFVNPTAPVTKG